MVGFPTLAAVLIVFIRSVGALEGVFGCLNPNFPYIVVYGILFDQINPDGKGH